MSEYMFAPTKKKITKTTARKLNAIARRHGADFVGPVRIPGNDLTGWFAGPNRGFPFDREMHEAVMRDVEAAGIEI